MGNQLKQCPYCGEMIKSAAIKCRYCQSWLNDKPVQILPSHPVNQKDKEHQDPREKRSVGFEDEPGIGKATSISQQSGLDDFLDSVAAHVTYAGRLQKLCIAAIVLTVYSCFASSVTGDEYYRSSFLNALAWFDNHIGWLMELLDGFIGLCILLALRIVLKRHHIHTWISLCIVAGAISVIFNLITPDSFVSVIPATASGLLMIELGYKMYKSSIVHIKNAGIVGMIVSALEVAFIFLYLPWVFIEFISGGKLTGYVSLLALYCFLTVKYYVLLKKLFKIEYSL